MMKKTNLILFLITVVFSLCIHACAEETVPETHECSGIVFDIPLHGTVKGTLEPGNYYLDGDCVLVGHVMIYGEVRLCLNGYSVSVEGATTFRVRDGGNFSIYDCSGNGIIGHYKTHINNHPLTVDEGGTANVYGGWLYGKQGSNAINSKGTVNVYGGRIESTMPGYCGVRNEYELNIYGGTFLGNAGISQRIPGVINIYADEFVVSSNVAAFQYIRDVSPLNVLTRFYKWRTDPDGEFTESTDKPFVPDRSMTYVEFAPLTRSIEYVTDGAELPEDAVSEYKCGEGCLLPETLEKEGFVFLGWYDDAENGSRITSVPEDACEDIVVYARFEKLPEPEPVIEEPAEEEQEAVSDEEPVTAENNAPKASGWVIVTLSAAALVIVALLIILFKKKNRS